jgi:hypothetical protein
VLPLWWHTDHVSFMCKYHWEISHYELFLLGQYEKLTQRSTSSWRERKSMERFVKFPQPVLRAWKNDFMCVGVDIRQHETSNWMDHTLFQCDSFTTGLKATTIQQHSKTRLRVIA